MVEEHLQECPACRDTVSMLLETEIEDTLHHEKESVIQYGARQFRRRSAAVGSAVSGAVMIPILICVIGSLVRGPSVNWVSLVMAACLIPASLIIVPLTVREDKLFWTFCAFTASLMVLLGITCLVSRGNWFWIASSATLFGLAVALLPALIHARPVKKLIGGANKALIVVSLDAALFVNMLNMIRASQGMTPGALILNPSTLIFSLLLLAGVALVIAEIVRKAGKKK